MSKRVYKLGDMYSNDFDYTGMLLKGTKVTVNTPLKSLEKLFDSMEDVNYHTASAPLWTAIQKLRSGDTNISREISKFHELVQVELKDNIVG